MMIGTLFFVTVGLLLSVSYLVQKRNGGAKSKRDQNLTRLEEVIRGTELTNNSFFHSLQLVQTNLESLLVRAESAEQRLRSLMLQPGVEKKDHYAAAALLLAEGQNAARVANMLNLPPHQVQLVDRLGKVVRENKVNAARTKREEEALLRQESQRSKVSGSQENGVRPIMPKDFSLNGGCVSLRAKREEEALLRQESQRSKVSGSQEKNAARTNAAKDVNRNGTSASLRRTKVGSRFNGVTA